MLAACLGVRGMGESRAMAHFGGGGGACVVIVVNRGFAGVYGGVGVGVRVRVSMPGEEEDRERSRRAAPDLIRSRRLARSPSLLFLSLFSLSLQPFLPTLLQLFSIGSSSSRLSSFCFPLVFSPIDYIHHPREQRHQLANRQSFHSPILPASRCSYDFIALGRQTGNPHLLLDQPR